MKRPARKTLVTVVQMTNHTLREVFIGTTRLLITRLMRRPRFPQAARHWKRTHKIEYRCLEYSLPPSQAAAVVRSHGRSLDGCWTLLSSRRSRR